MNESRSPYRDRYFEEMCQACNDDFRKHWRVRNNYDDTINAGAADLIEWLSGRLSTLAKRRTKGQSIIRCECLNVWGRCRNYGTIEISGRQICEFHNHRIAKGWIPTLTKEGRTNLWRQKVEELLYGDWSD